MECTLGFRFSVTIANSKAKWQKGSSLSFFFTGIISSNQKWQKQFEIECVDESGKCHSLLHFIHLFNHFWLTEETDALKKIVKYWKKKRVNDGNSRLEFVRVRPKFVKYVGISLHYTSLAELHEICVWIIAEAEWK